MKIGFASSNKKFSALVKAGDVQSREFMDKFAIFHVWMLPPAALPEVSQGWSRYLLTGSKGQTPDLEFIKAKIKKMPFKNRPQDRWVLNEFLLMDGSFRSGWDFDQLSCVVEWLCANSEGKIILNEMHPPFNAVWHTWRLKKWEFLNQIARDLINRIGDRIEIGIQIHSRIETAEFIVGALPDLFEVLGGLPKHISESSCFVKPEFTSTATNFYRDTLTLADNANCLTYTPWWLFETDPNNPPMPPYPYGVTTGLFPALDNSSSLEDVLANPLPGWEYFEARLGGDG